MNDTRDFLMNPPEIEIPKKKKDLTYKRDEEFENMIGGNDDDDANAMTSSRKITTKNNPFFQFTKETEMLKNERKARSVTA